uniref:Uncharacterized protein LOC111102455 n=1 Tax=Crassostrea virginica TaxID=6565 RepID=A0A8B8AHC8_CRAVI|nr:uncharacterized protein LOC111102455 [Crassostrea virginica]
MELLYLLRTLTILTSWILLYECRQLHEYTFPVYTTEFCPRNESEWKARSSVFNCPGDYSYACFPNNEITELIEFCYNLPIIAIPKGGCLFLNKRNSKIDWYDCTSFPSGCPDEPYRGSFIYKYPKCVEIENGCFLAAPSCESASKPTTQETTTEETTTQNTTTEETTRRETTLLGQNTDNSPDSSTAQHIIKTIASLSGILIPICTIGCLYVFCDRREQILSKKNKDEESSDSQEGTQLLNDHNKAKHKLEKKTFREGDIFKDWLKEDGLFSPTIASDEVERMIKTKNIVTVAGHSGSGKSAIIQHIALKYRKNGWVVKPVYSLDEIFVIIEKKRKKICTDKTLFVLHDPFGKWGIDEWSFSFWRSHETKLESFLQDHKLLLSCRSIILHDTRIQQLEHFQEDSSDVIFIDKRRYKLGENEKRQIFKKHNPHKQINEQILQINAYFPLLCNLFAKTEENNEDQLTFFNEPAKIIKKEIANLKPSHKKEFCGLLCLVFFNNKLCLDDMRKNDELFKECLRLCELPDNTSAASILKHLKRLMDFYVTKTNDACAYQFYHDFIMEVTNCVFGEYYPVEMIKHADISFLRRRVRLENGTNLDKTIKITTVTLRDSHIPRLVDRFSQEIVGNRFLEVVLNPCLRDEKIIEEIVKQIDDNSEILQNIGKEIRSTWRKHDINVTKEGKRVSRFDFVTRNTEISPLFALIAFRHDEISRHCLGILKQKQNQLFGGNLFSAVCCNGGKNYLEMFTKEEIKKCLEIKLGHLYPIETLSAFLNHELLEALKNAQVLEDIRGTPLTLAAGSDAALAAGNDAELNSSKSPRDKTIEILLSIGHGVNILGINGYSPLYIACEHGYDSTVKLLLQNGADANLCDINGVSPLSKACENGHCSTVKCLLAECNTAIVNLRNKNGASPLFTACERDFYKTAFFLLKYGADINLSNDEGVTPLSKACQKGHYNTVKLLLNLGADVNSCRLDGTSPLFNACESGYDRIVELLLQKKAGVNLGDLNGDSPLSITCLYGYDSTVDILIKNGADVNQCNKEGESPLHMACTNGQCSTVEFLINHGANVNIQNKYGNSPLHEACKTGHNSTVHLLLENKAEIDICNYEGVTPLFEACENKQNSTVELLLQMGATIDLCNNDRVSPLAVACEKGYIKIVQCLLNKQPNISLCSKDGKRPISRASENGHKSIVKLLSKKCS